MSINLKNIPSQADLSDKCRFPSLAIDGILDENAILEKLSVKKKVKEAIEKHNHSVYQLKTGYWITEVDDDTRPNGRRKVQKSTEEKIWLFLADWYANDGGIVTLERLYPEWLDYKRTPKNASNIKRIEASWRSYYADEPLSQTIIKTSLKELKAKDLAKWATELIRKHSPVDQKKFSRIFSIINQCLEYAVNWEEYGIDANVWQTAKKRLNRDLIEIPATPLDSEQVFTDDERRQLNTMVYEDLDRYSEQASTAGLQILFILETALRRGEACGLKWSDIHNGWMTVQRQADNNGVREWTKTASSRRMIPLTDRAQEILDDVKEFNEKHGYDKDWIFQSDNPNYDYRLSYWAAEKKLTKLCARLETPNKSLHKLRKTCLSTLLDNPNVNNRTVQRFAGHSSILTTQNFYNYERKNLIEQAKAINDALKI